MAAAGNYEHLYLDLYRAAPSDRDTPAHRLLKRVRSDYPYLKIENADALIRRLRTIKQPCEIEAMRRAEEITCAGITSLMKASRPGMYEYQYKAVFDYTLGQYEPQGSGFPSIISAGKTISASTTTPIRVRARPWMGTWCSTTWGLGPIT